MKVWTLTTGCYEDKTLQGVFASAELAKAKAVQPPVGIEWQYDEKYEEYYNGLDWSDCAYVEAYTVEGLDE